MVDVDRIIKVYARALEHSFVDDSDGYDDYYCMNALVYTVCYYDDFGSVREINFISPSSIDTEFLVYDKVNCKDLFCVDEIGLNKIYRIVDENEEFDFRSIHLEYRRKNLDSKIIFEGDLANGFKLVRFENGEFGYLDSDENFMPYCFDFATNFGSNGLAIACRGGKVNFIDKDFMTFKAIEDRDSFFDFVNTNSSLEKVKIDDGLPGYEGVTNFTDGGFCAVGYSSNWHSRIFNKDKVSYLIGLDGSIKTIHPYNGYGSDFVCWAGIRDFTILDNSIFNCSNKKLYLDSGICISAYDAYRMANEKGLNEFIFPDELSRLLRVKNIHVCGNGDFLMFSRDLFDLLENFNIELSYDFCSGDSRFVRVFVDKGVFIDGERYDYSVYLRKLFSSGTDFLDNRNKSIKKVN